MKDKVYVDLNVFDRSNNNLDAGQHKRVEPQVREGVCE